MGDVLQDANGVDVGVVYRNTGSALYVAALDVKTGQTYDQAVSYANSYVPSGSSDANFGAGKWHLPSKTELNSSVLQQYAMYTINGTYAKIKGSGTLESSWTSTENGTSAAYIRNCCDTTTTYAKTTGLRAIPVQVISY